MMKPKAENEHSTGMLEYLEDVIGTVRYKVSIFYYILIQINFCISLITCYKYVVCVFKILFQKPITKLEEKLQAISLEKSEKMTRMKFVAKDREELVELAFSAVRFLKLENHYIRYINKKTQFTLFVYLKILSYVYIMMFYCLIFI